MSGVFESPIQITLLAGLATAILVGGWIQTGIRHLLYAAIGVALVGIALLVAERLIVTDREAVEITLRQMARDVESNDIDAIVRHIHPSQQETLAKARSELPSYHLDSVRITRIHTIRIESDRQPPRAVCEFNVVASGQFGTFGSAEAVPRFVVLTLQKDDGTWKVTAYEHYNAQYGFLNRER